MSYDRAVVWQDLVAIDPVAKLIRLRSRKGKVYDVSYEKWKAKLSEAEVKAHLMNNEFVRVYYNFENRIVNGVYIASKIKSQAQQVQNDTLSLVLGARPRISEDEAKMEVWRTDEGWKYRLSLWGEEGKGGKISLGRVVFESKQGYYGRVEALRAAIQEARAYIIENVLGRDLSTFLPREDKFSVAGREWLRTLERIVHEYLKKSVSYANHPAGVRFSVEEKIDGETYIFNAAGNVALIKKEPEKTKIWERVEGSVAISARANPYKPFVKIGKSIYNLYHICAVLESIESRRYLKRDGGFLREIRGDEIFTDVHVADRAILFSGRGGTILLGSVQGVEMKYVQAPEIKNMEVSR